MDTLTERLVLHPLRIDEAKRMLAGTPSARDRWGPGYPLVDELDALPGFIAVFGRDGDPQPFGLYGIRRRADGLAIGGIGFFGPPVNAVAELGFGLVENARGHGLAAEALIAAIAIARSAGAASVIADTALSNIASQKTMLAAGMVEVHRDSRLIHYEIVL